MGTASSRPPSPSRHITVGTAGHIDHGKTELVKALTGTNPDRLKEEKERGITTDIGFAYLDLESGTHCAIVDVPGHEDFIRNMLAGVGGIDVVLLIVAADEGVKPQTREHLDICRLLEIPRGIIVITKSDLADKELLHLVESEVRDLSKGTPLEHAPIIRTSARTGTGLAELKSTIDEMARDIGPHSSASDLFRLPIDRVFVMQGFGTVVTGTVASGRVRTGEEIDLFSLQDSTPRRAPVRVRALQSHKNAVEEALAGQRVAVNLQGIRKEDVARGDLLATSGAFEPSARMDVLLQATSPLPHPIRTQTQATLHLRTFFSNARILLHNHKELAAGEETPATLVLDRPAVGAWGDRFVLLGTTGYQRTIGGGKLLDPLAAKRRYRDKAEPLSLLGRASAANSIAPFLSLHGRHRTLGDLSKRTGISLTTLREHVKAVQADGAVVLLRNDTVVLREIYEQTRKMIHEYVTAFHADKPYEKGISREELRQRLRVEEPLLNAILEEETASGAIRIAEDRVASGRFQLGTQKKDEDLRVRVLNLFMEASSAPPSVKEAEDFLHATGVSRILQLLENQAQVVRVAPDLYFHREAIETLRLKLIRFFDTHPAMSPADLKDLAGVTRKHAIPLLEYFDRIRLTRREGNVRKLHSAPPKVK
ncbi:MAG: selenocysteine-specific translation elongation factor [Nitrospirae bacterium]|nr:selenocysteine-specific translation elongation factor [Nitrospirota bacterium]